MRVSINIHL